MTDAPIRPSDTESWIRSTTLGRRGVVAGGVAAAGYALAAQPISASAISTPATGLDAGWVTVPTGGFAMRAYRARPTGKKHAPVILIVHEIFGLHEWVQDMVRRYAKAGYHAIAPDLFQRKGRRGPRLLTSRTLIDIIVMPTPDPQVLADLDATVVFAGKDGGDTKRLGITGYCWGGRVTWLYAAHNPKLRVGVACYGGLAKGRNATAVLDIVPQLKAPVLGLYGGLDKGIPQTDVAAMRAALASAHKSSKIEVFDGADHGFLADYRPSYNEAAAAKAWADGLAWFETVAGLALPRLRGEGSGSVEQGGFVSTHVAVELLGIFGRQHRLIDIRALGEVREPAALFLIDMLADGADDMLKLVVPFLAGGIEPFQQKHFGLSSRLLRVGQRCLALIVGLDHRGIQDSLFGNRMPG